VFDAKGRFAKQGQNYEQAEKKRNFAKQRVKVTIV
jgi:hypothetical protein